MLFQIPEQIRLRRDEGAQKALQGFENEDSILEDSIESFKDQFSITQTTVLDALNYPLSILEEAKDPRRQSEQPQSLQPLNYEHFQEVKIKQPAEVSESIELIANIYQTDLDDSLEDLEESLNL